MMRDPGRALPAESDDESHAGEMAMRDLMDLADADFDAVLPAAPTPLGQAPPAFPIGSLGHRRWPLICYPRYR